MGYPYQYEMPWSMISPLQQLLKNLVSRSHFQSLTADSWPSSKRNFVVASTHLKDYMHRLKPST